MLEILLIALAEIIEIRLSICGLCKAVLGAASITSEEVATAAALTWHTPLLLSTELELPFAIHHLQKSVLSDVSKLIFREDKVVARVDVSVELHDTCMSAAAGHSTQSRIHSDPIGKSRIEYLYEVFSHIIADPLVKDCAQEISPIFGSN